MKIYLYLYCFFMVFIMVFLSSFFIYKYNNNLFTCKQFQINDHKNNIILGKLNTIYIEADVLTFDQIHLRL